MIFDAITSTDALGREFILRSAEPDDSEALIRYLRETSAETPYLTREPDEVTLTTEQEQAFIRSRMESPREVMLVALMDGELMGSASLMACSPFLRYRHRCGVAIALYQKFCGAGIGGIMLKTMLSIAKQAGYEQAELEVVKGNAAALRLYERLGFEVCGTFPNNIKYPDGSYADALWMMKPLTEDDFSLIKKY